MKSPSREAPCAGVSLSGGGHRATLFGLGVLLGIVEAGHNRHVEWISSVSGGSLANGFVAARCDFRHATAGEFSEICQDALRQITQFSSITGSRRGVLRVVAYFGLITLFIALAILAIWLLPWPFGIAVGTLVLGVAYLQWYLRGWLVEHGLADAWCRSKGENEPLNLAGIDRTVEHIFSTVDVLSATPIFIGTTYFGAERLYRTRSISMAKAVRASAAFPGLLPPVRLCLDDQVVDSGELALEGGPWRLLIDGGVYNNRGTEWAARIPEYNHDSDGLILRKSHQSNLLVHIVADSGQEFRRSSLSMHSLPVLGLLYTLLRVNSVLYQSTLRTLTDDDAEKVCHISSRERPGWGGYLPDRLRFPVNNSDIWRLIAWTTRTTKTHLWRMPPDEATRILAHGYALTVGKLIESDKDCTFEAWDGWLRAAVESSLPGKTFTRELNRRRSGLPQPYWRSKASRRGKFQVFKRKR